MGDILICREYVLSFSKVAKLLDTRKLSYSQEHVCVTHIGMNIPKRRQTKTQHKSRLPHLQSLLPHQKLHAAVDFILHLCRHRALAVHHEGGNHSPGCILPRPAYVRVCECVHVYVYVYVYEYGYVNINVLRA